MWVKIHSTKSGLKIETKERIVESTSKLLNTINNIEKDLIALHPNREDEKSYKMINKSMFEKGNAKIFKEAISECIHDMIQISSAYNMNITS
jgi:hypothetical protein